MAITSSTRRCTTCGSLYESGDPACSSCGGIKCPDVKEWPAGAKRLLYLLCIVDAIQTKLERTEQEQHEWLLERAIRGRWHPGGRLVPMAASAVDCYPEFIAALRPLDGRGFTHRFRRDRAIARRQVRTP